MMNTELIKVYKKKITRKKYMLRSNFKKILKVHIQFINSYIIKLWGY